MVRAMLAEVEAACKLRLWAARRAATFPLGPLTPAGYPQFQTESVHVKRPVCCLN